MLSKVRVLILCIPSASVHAPAIGDQHQFECSAFDDVLLGTDLAADLGDDAALAAVDRFAEANFSRITNKSGFLMVR